MSKVSILKNSRISTYFTILLAITFSIFLYLQFYSKLLTSNVHKCPNIPPVNHKLLLQNNRITLFTYLNNTLPNSKIILASSPRPHRTDADSEYPNYRQNSNVMYILGEFQIAGALVLLNINERLEINIFLPSQSNRDNIFNGPIPNSTFLTNHLQVDGVYQISEISDFLSNSSNIYTTSSPLDVSMILGPLNQSITVEFNEIAVDAFHSSRFIKNKYELQLLKHASTIASFAHLKIQSLIENTVGDLNEMDIFSAFEYFCSICNGRIQAYSPIVGAGIDGSILHFRTGENSSRAYENIQAPKLVLVDAAPEYYGYASDLTRTYSRNNKNTIEMNIILDIVTKVNLETIKIYKLGFKWSDVVNKAIRKMSELMLEQGLLIGELEEIISEKVYLAFMPHGIGHSVGLDVHDPVPREFKNESVNRKWLEMFLDTHSSDYVLKKGMVHTIEPGIYFIKELLESTKISEISKYINWKKVEKFMDLGGVRVEDVVYIDMDGETKIITRA